MIDLSDLPTYDPDRDHYGCMELRDKYKDGDYYKVDDVKSALARATPQHPGLDAAQLEPLLNDWFGLEDCKGLFNPGRLLAFANAARRAIPQHSVTEQDERVPGIPYPTTRADLARIPPEALWNRWRPDGTWPDAKTAFIAARNIPFVQSLASTAATHPEQASIKTWKERCGDAGPTPSLNQALHAMKAEIADLRAALAIPASTARIQPEPTLIQALETGDDRESASWFGIKASEVVGYVEEGYKVRKLYEQADSTPASTAASEQPVAWLATDLDGHGDVAFTKEEAKRRAGENCTDYVPLYSAAASEKQASVSDDDIKAIAIDYAQFIGGDVYDVTKYDCAEDFFNCVRACIDALSGRATIPSDAGERARTVVGYSIKHVAGHGWIIDPPQGSRWIAFDDTPAGDFMAALTQRATTAAGQQGAAHAQLERAERALRRAGFEDLGGEEWKPPIGHPPRFIEVATPPEHSNEHAPVDTARIDANGAFTFPLNDNAGQ